MADLNKDIGNPGRTDEELNPDSGVDEDSGMGGSSGDRGDGGLEADKSDNDTGDTGNTGNTGDSGSQSDGKGGSKDFGDPTPSNN